MHLCNRDAVMYLPRYIHVPIIHWWQRQKWEISDAICARTCRRMNRVSHMLSSGNKWRGKGERLTSIGFRAKCRCRRPQTVVFLVMVNGVPCAKYSMSALLWSRELKHTDLSECFLACVRREKKTSLFVWFEFYSRIVGMMVSKANDEHGRWAGDKKK